MDQQEERLRARLTGQAGEENFDINWLVEAGAGAGKTWLIVQRIVRQLTSGWCAPEEVAAITFTNKSTGELRERLERELRRRRDNASDPAERQRLETLAAAAGRMQVSTIHGFCQTLLSAFPLEAGVPLDAEVCAGEEHAALARTFFQQLCREEPERFAAAEQLGLRREALVDLFVHLADQAGVEADFCPPESAAGRARLARFLEEADRALLTLRERFGGLPDSAPLTDELRWALSLPAPPDIEGAARLARLLRQLDSQQARRDLPGFKGAKKTWRVDALADTEDESLTERWSRLRELWDAVRRGQTRLEKLKARKRDLEAARQEAEELTAALSESRDQLSALLAQPDLAAVWAAVNYLEKREDGLLSAWEQVCHGAGMAALAGCLADWRREKRARGILSYGDLLEHARDLLQSSPRARQALGRRFRVIYVDEFQDTDPVQAQLLLALTHSGAQLPADWQNCAPRPGSLFLVGDPKQAIYRFRGADIDIYNRVKALFARGAGEVAVLAANFRSAPALCRFANDTFRPLLTGGEYQADFTPMEAQKAGPPLSGAFTFPSPRGTEAQADRVAAFVAGAVTRGYRYGDFLILCSRKRDVNCYAAALHARDIPVNVSGSHRLGDTLPIRRAMAWCRALLAPEDRGVQALVLMECFGAGPEDLRRNTEPVLRGWEALERLRRLAGQLPPAALLEELFRGDWGLWPKGPRDTEDWAWVRLFLSRLSQMGRKSLPELLRAALALGETQAEQELSLVPDPDQVRVMNLHKAKGLESRVVILAHDGDRTLPPVEHRSGGRLTCPIWKDSEWGRSTVLCAPEGWEEARSREEAYLAAERQRLRYVAATRAEKLLLVARPPEDSRSESFWGALTDCPLLEERGAPLWKPLFGEDVPVSGPAVQAVSLPGPEADRDWKVLAAGLPRGDRLAVTPSRLDHPAPPAALEEGADGPEPPAAPPAERSPGPHGPEWGTIVHRLCELAVRSGDFSPAALAVLARQAVGETLPLDGSLTAAQREQMLGGEQLSDIPALRAALSEQAAEACAFLADPASPLRRLMGAGACRPELPFSLTLERGEDLLYRHMAAALPGGVTPTRLEVQGVIDLAIRTPEGWTVVDYKTDRLRSGESEGAYRLRLAAEYGNQLRAYALTLERLGLGAVKRLCLCAVPLGGALIELEAGPQTSS